MIDLWMDFVVNVQVVAVLDYVKKSAVFQTPVHEVLVTYLVGDLGDALIAGEACFDPGEFLPQLVVYERFVSFADVA